MKTYENTFIRGPSPTYSDEVSSENAMSTTPIGTVEAMEQMPSSSGGDRDNFLDEKFNCVYDAGPYMSPEVQKRGRNTFAFWTIVTILLVLTVGNLILTLTIIGVLHLGKGIHGMELIPEEDIIKFYGSTDLDRICSKSVGQIDGFEDVPVTITAEDSNAYVRLYHKGQSHNRIVLDKSGVQFNGVNTFEVKDPESGATVFSTHRPRYNMPSGAGTLLTKVVSASKITSPIGRPLSIEADGRVSIRGSEGILLDGFSALLQAEHNIVINSTQGATIFEASSGIYLDMDKVPIVSSEFGLRTGSVQYKICICIPQGILFRIAIPHAIVHNGPKISCAHFSSTHDLCAMN